VASEHFERWRRSPASAAGAPSAAQTPTGSTASPSEVRAAFRRPQSPQLTTRALATGLLTLENEDGLLHLKHTTSPAVGEALDLILFPGARVRTSSAG
jgi:hypothetical protein